MGRVTPGDIEAAVRALRAGELVAFPTETVYGLGADARNPAAVRRIFEVKGRPARHPVIVHLADRGQLFEWAREVPPGAARLAEQFWPGPLTLVLPRAASVDDGVTGGQDSVAVRVPAHPVAHEMLALADLPIAAPSANRSGHISPTSAAHVLASLGGRIAAVLDSGPCAVGLESTVLDLSGPAPVLLRPGGVTREALEAVIGPLSTTTAPGAALAAPGMLASHYAPNLPVRLNATAPGPDEAFLAFGPARAGALLFQLSETQNLIEAAANLFKALHWLDEHAAHRGLAAIAAAPIPAVGLGLAINDRLARAAAPRG